MVYDPSMNYDAVLFDAAETLFTTKGSVGELYGSVARNYGSTATPAEIQAAFVRQFSRSGPLIAESEKEWWKDVVHRVFTDVGMVEHFDRFFDEVYERFRDSRGWILFPETKDVLRKLKRLALKLGVISNFDSRLYSAMRSLDILPLLDGITISCEPEYAKPHMTIFTAAIRSLGVRAGRILLVGDSLEDDVLAGLNSGLDAVLLDRSGRYTGIESVQRIQDLRPVLTLVGPSPKSVLDASP